MYMVTPATEASMIAVGHFANIFDPGKNGLQLTDDSVTRLDNEFAMNDPNVIFSYIPFQDDDTERLVEMCSLEMLLLQNVNANKVTIIADTRHTQRWSDCKVDPMLCKRDLAFFCSCTVTLENLRLWAHERTSGIPRNVDDLETVEFADVLGAIAEEQHLTRCAQVCFTVDEEDQAEQRDQATTDEVLGDQDLEEGRDALEEADREADLLEQMPLLGHPESERERLASWLRLPRRARVAIRRLHRNLRHLPKEALVQMLRAARAPQGYVSAAKTFRCEGCATTQSRDLKHTQCHRPDFVRSITKWESTCSRSCQLVCSSQS